MNERLIETRYTPLGDVIKVMDNGRGGYSVFLDAGSRGYNWLTFPNLAEAMTVAENFRNKRIRQYMASDTPKIGTDKDYRDTVEYLERIGA